MGTASNDQGPKYATLDQVGVGTKIKVDGGFTCIDEGETRVLARDDGGTLYFDCGCGRHKLVAQMLDQTNTSRLLGIYISD